MDTFVLYIKRQSGVVAAAASTKVIVDDSQRTSIKAGGVKHFTLPRRAVNVVLLNQVPLGKDIRKQVTIDPRDAVEVTLVFSYKFNLKALLPYGAFTQQTSFIETEIIYGPSESCPRSVPSSTEQELSTSAPDTDVKYCTECGIPNPQTAKFCKNCGKRV